MVFITIVTGAYKPTYILGASHCMYIYIYISPLCGVPLANHTKRTQNPSDFAQLDAEKALPSAAQLTDMWRDVLGGHWVRWLKGYLNMWNFMGE